MTKKYIGVVPFWPLRTIDSENYFLQPALFARKQGYYASIFILSSDSESKESSSAGIPLRFFSSPLDLYRSLPKGAIVHYQTSCRGIFLLLFLHFLRQKNCRVIWMPHTSFGKGYPSNLPFNFFKVFSSVFRRFHRIATITKYEEEYLRNLGCKNVFYLPLVIDSKRFECGKSLENKPVFNLLFLGGDRPVKGIIGVLKAASLLHRLNFDFRFFIMGEVGLCFKKTYAHLISPNVSFLGRLDPNAPIFLKTFKEASCFINNSFFEGHPLAVSEAAAAGLSLCLSNLPTLKKTFGENALYHNPNNYLQLVSSILFFYYNPKIGEKHAKKNKEVIKDFSYLKFEARFKELLIDLEY